MKWLDLTLPTAAENLALDEALLLEAEGRGQHGQRSQVLRIWEPTEHFVVLGRSSRRADEVNLDACRRQGIGVYRRSSGGATVLVGPGCLMYAVVLGGDAEAALAGVSHAHQFVLSRNWRRCGRIARSSRRPARATWRWATASSRATASAACASTSSITARSSTTFRWSGSANACGCLPGNRPIGRRAGTTTFSSTCRWAGIRSLPPCVPPGRPANRWWIGRASAPAGWRWRNTRRRRGMRSCRGEW